MTRFCLLALSLYPVSVNAQDWPAQKCAFYTEAWDWVMKTQDLSNIGPAFMVGHQEFIDQSCDQRIRICPVGEAERKLADMLTVMSMNEGMASTFVPFSCK